MRRHRRGSALRAALVILVAAWSIAGCELAAQATPSTTAEPTERSTPTPARTSTPEPSVAAVILPPAPEGPTTEALVVRVVDGDTVEVEIGGGTYLVRYIGIDAPALDDEVGADEPLAREAAAANRGLVEGKTVVLEQDVSERDEDGQLLRYVWVDVNGTQRLVNHILLARGFAELFSVPPDVRYELPFRIAEAAARERSAGIWAPETAEPTDDATAASEEPSSAPEAIVVEDETPIGAGQTAFRGVAGEYRWTTVTFTSENDFAMRWSATSTSGGCRMEWTLSGGAANKQGDSSLTEPGQANGRARLQLEGTGSSELRVTSDCRKWLITFNEIIPPPTPAPTLEPTPQPSLDPNASPSAEPTA